MSASAPPFTDEEDVKLFVAILDFKERYSQKMKDWEKIRKISGLLSKTRQQLIDREHNLKKPKKKKQYNEIMEKVQELRGRRTVERSDVNPVYIPGFAVTTHDAGFSAKLDKILDLLALHVSKEVLGSKQMYEYLVPEKERRTMKYRGFIAKFHTIYSDNLNIEESVSSEGSNEVERQMKQIKEKFGQTFDYEKLQNYTSGRSSDEKTGDDEDESDVEDESDEFQDETVVQGKDKCRRTVVYSSDDEEDDGKSKESEDFGPRRVAKNVADFSLNTEMIDLTCDYDDVSGEPSVKKRMIDGHSSAFGNDREEKSKSCIQGLIELHNTEPTFKSKLKLDITVDDDSARNKTTDREGIKSPVSSPTSGPSNEPKMKRTGRILSSTPKASLAKRRVAFGGRSDSFPAQSDGISTAHVGNIERPTTSSSSGLILENKTSRTKADWRRILQHADKHNIQLSTLESSGWKDLLDDAKIKTDASEEEIKADFYSHAVPILTELKTGGNKVSLKISEIDKFLFMAIYHSVRNPSTSEVQRVIDEMMFQGKISWELDCVAIKDGFLKFLVFNCKDGQEMNTTTEKLEVFKETIFADMMDKVNKRDN